MKKTFFVLMSLLLGNTMVFSADEILREDNPRLRGRLMERFHHFQKKQYAKKMPAPTPIPLSDIRKKEAVRSHHVRRYAQQRVMQHRPHMQHRHRQAFHYRQRIQQQPRVPLQRVQQRFRNPMIVRHELRKSPQRVHHRHHNKYHQMRTAQPRKIQAGHHHHKHHHVSHHHRCHKNVRNAWNRYAHTE